MPKLFSRREAIALSALGAAGYLARAAGSNGKLDIACIGIGGQGSGHVKAAATNQNLVALCDVDSERGGKMFEAYPNPKRFVDFRKMFDEMEKGIDAVVVSTPDHTHFHPAYWAMQRGKHVYLEKPLAHNLWQVRTLTELARAKKVATQLGNQRHANPNLARVVELIRAKAIGDVKEVHAWIGTSRGMPKDKEAGTCPKTLDWDLWVGPAPDRGYSKSFAPYNWRFWWDYGTGETGNWGCHILDVAFWALDLKYPSKVSVTDAKPDADKTPTTMRTRFEFPNVVLHWGQGAPPIVAEKGIDKGFNCVFVGTQGILASNFDKLKLYPEEKFKGFVAPPPSIPKSIGFQKEWYAACQGGPAASCQFDYGGPMTETVLLANVAYRVGGFDWNAKAMKASNPLAAPLLKEEMRKGWEIG